MAVPGDEVAAGRGPAVILRALAPADREQVVGTLKAAFVQAGWSRTNSTCGVGLARALADLRGAGRPHR